MHPTAAHHAGRRRGGFTLIEVLVTVGIIIVLTSLVVAAVLKSKTTALVIRARGDLASIEQALDAYRADFADYPRFVDPSVDQAAKAASPVQPGNGLWLDADQSGAGLGTDRGARLLCRALIGPAGGGTLAAAVPGDDGADGPGFRLRRNMTGPNGTPPLAGRVFGPYLQPDKWKLVFEPAPTTALASGDTPSLMYNAKILDVYGNPILYYPGTPGGAARITNPSGFARPADPISYAPPSNGLMAVYPLYNSFDNQVDTTPPLGSTAAPHLLLDAAQMAYILGDRGNGSGGTIPNGKVDPGEAAVTTGPYLLWTAGADGVYGFGPDPANPNYGLDPNAAKVGGKKVDDVCNFDVPPDLHK